MTLFDSFSIQDYRAALGRAPRGQGSWAFSLHRDGRSTTQFFLGTFTEAKKAAMAEARRLGCELVRLEA